MSIGLLDANVLIAMSWPGHIHNIPARKWFELNREQGWATCPSTEAAFVRLSAHPLISGMHVSVTQAMNALEDHRTDPFHKFWPQQNSVLDLPPEIQSRLTGHQQLTDALLLDLAIRHSGKLVTLDHHVRALLPAGSPHQSAIEIISEG